MEDKNNEAKPWYKNFLPWCIIVTIGIIVLFVWTAPIVVYGEWDFFRSIRSQFMREVIIPIVGATITFGGVAFSVNKTIKSNTDARKGQYDHEREQNNIDRQMKITQDLFIFNNNENQKLIEKSEEIRYLVYSLWKTAYKENESRYMESFLGSAKLKEKISDDVDIIISKIKDIILLLNTEEDSEMIEKLWQADGELNKISSLYSCTNVIYGEVVEPILILVDISEECLKHFKKIENIYLDQYLKQNK